MVRMICLDGVSMSVEVDLVEIDLRGPGLKPCSAPDAVADHGCEPGERWQPLMCFHDGSTLFLDCPPDADPAFVGYKLESPTPHRWNIRVLNGEQRVALLGWEAC